MGGSMERNWGLAGLRLDSWGTEGQRNTEVAGI